MAELIGAPAAAQTRTGPFRSLREFLDVLDAAGELSRITEPVDWNLELGAFSRRGLDLKAPALLFESITGYPPGYRVLANILGPTRPVIQGRLALALGLPKETPTLELIDEFGRRCRTPIPPRVVNTSPCKENVRRGDDVDLFQFPAPFLHGTDGGRYLGTWHVDVTRDPDSGWVNWGMYRHMIHDRNSMGWLATPAQHGPTHYYRKYEARGMPMPMAVAIGTEPICSVAAATQAAAGVNEVDIAGALRGEPVDLVRCETIDLEVPASAEIVLEGHVYPHERLLEGEFGEFHGYAAGTRLPRPVFRVECVTYRSDPILTISNMSKGWHEANIVASIATSSMLAEDLRSRGIPFRALYVPAPQLCVIVSADQVYPGFSHTLACAIWACKGGVYRPYVIIVGSDVDVTDPEDVFWCLTTRLHPVQGIHVQTHAPGTATRPFLHPDEKRLNIGSKVYFDATFPPEWGPEHIPQIIDFEHAWPVDVRERVLARWKGLGLP